MGDSAVSGESKVVVKPPPPRHLACSLPKCSLQYYANDYTPILNNNSFANIIESFGANAKPLYNGNISSMVVNIPKLGNANVYAYTYDHLNRLTAMDAWGGLNNATNQFTPVSLNGAYQERITYGPNGNILTYKRNGNKTGATSTAVQLSRLTIDGSRSGKEQIPAGKSLPAGFVLTD